jgi:Asp-tRNA(Asn)/Glu-tRNA(Gln) amidotransferase A subunit family amidase
MSAAFRELCERGGEVKAVAYLRALDLRASLRAALGDLFRRYDAIVTPPAAGEAPRSLATTGDAAFCAIWTLCGMPCVAFPTGVGPQGMPLGLQLVGPYLCDRATLRVAQWCSDRLPFAACLPY